MEEYHTTSIHTSIDRQALAGIYDQYSPKIFRFAYHLLGDREGAEDCVAETFSRFLHVLQGGRNPDNIQAYLYRMAHNWITDSYRRQPRMVTMDAELHADPQNDPEQTVAMNLEKERLRIAILKLPPDQRLVISLRFLEERSHEEAAEILGKTVEATRALQHRAVTALRRMLVEQEE